MRRLILDGCKLLTEAFSLSLVIDNLGRTTNPKRKMLVQFAGAARFPATTELRTIQENLSKTKCSLEDILTSPVCLWQDSPCVTHSSAALCSPAALFSKTEQELRAERRMLMGSSSRALRVHCCDRLHFFSLPILLRFGFQQLDLMICVR